MADKWTDEQRRFLIEINEIYEEMEPYLRRYGRIFKAFRQQDSGCVSYGVALDGPSWRGGPALQAVVARAAAADRALRQQSVRQFVAEWLAAREHVER